jgi:hypothetical protein
MSRLRLVATIGKDVAAPLMVAKVYRDAENDAYVVRFYKCGWRHLSRADYETDNQADAVGTATADVRRNYRHSDPSAIPLSAREVA